MLKTPWTLIERPKYGFEEVFEVNVGSKIGSSRHLGTQNRLMMRLVSSRNSFLDYFGGPKEVKIDQKTSSDDAKNEKSENVDF